MSPWDSAAVDQDARWSIPTRSSNSCAAALSAAETARRNGFSGDEVAVCSAKHTFCRLVRPPNSDDVWKVRPMPARARSRTGSRVTSVRSAGSDRRSAG